MEEEYGWSIGASLAVIVGAGIFDLTLELGKFSGLVFALYSAYGLIGLTILFLIIAAVKQQMRWAKAAIIPAACVAMFWLVPSLL